MNRNKSLMILVAGPYRSGANADPSIVMLFLESASLQKALMKWLTPEELRIRSFFTKRKIFPKSQDDKLFYQSRLT